MNSDWFKGSLVLVATLSAGIFIGAWHERLHGQPVVDRGMAAPMSMSHEHVMQMLGESLGLDTLQRDAIAATLHRHQSQVDSAWSTMRPHVDATLDSTHAEIMKLLRPDQVVKFNHMGGHLHHRGRE